MKKILILYTSVGLGHKSMAQNIGYYLQGAGFKVRLEDALKVHTGPLVSIGKKIHNLLITTFPFVWLFLYDSPTFTKLSLPWRIRVAGRKHLLIKKIVEEFNPDLILSVETIPSSIVAYLKREGVYKGKFMIAFSDYHLHQYWLYEPFCDYYLANTQEQKQEMISLGVPEEKISVCGITLKPKVQVNIKGIGKRLDIKDGEKVALVSSGSMGTGIDEKLFNKFLKQPNIKTILVCGQNREIFEHLSKKFAATNSKVFGYYTPMDELYAVSDIFITKPGGLSVAEALSWRLPIVISHMLPQEIHNYNYLIKRNLILPLSQDPVTQALEELRSGEFKNALHQNLNVEKLFNNANVLVEAVSRQLQN